MLTKMRIHCQLRLFMFITFQNLEAPTDRLSIRHTADYLLLSRSRPDTAGYDRPLLGIHHHHHITITIATPFDRMQTNPRTWHMFSPRQAKCSQSVPIGSSGTVHQAIYRSFFCYLHASTYIEYIPSFLSSGHDTYSAQPRSVIATVAAGYPIEPRFTKTLSLCHMLPNPRVVLRRAHHQLR